MVVRVGQLRAVGVLMSSILKSRASSQRQIPSPLSLRYLIRHVCRCWTGGGLGRRREESTLKKTPFTAMPQAFPQAARPSPTSSLLGDLKVQNMILVSDTHEEELAVAPVPHPNGSVQGARVEYRESGVPFYKNDGILQTGGVNVPT